jgi:flavin reductase (DIM6/NTAB) family NADH-FMN oxidoreductase RutF
MFASTSAKDDRGDTKDSVANIRETGVFCVNIVEYAMREVMNVSSGPWPKEVDEFDRAGIARAPCRTIACSRVDNAPANLECRMTRIVELAGRSNFVVFGEVTGVHLRDTCLRDGHFDVLTYQPVARLGYRDYCRVTELFSLPRPGE